LNSLNQAFGPQKQKTPIVRPKPILPAPPPPDPAEENVYKAPTIRYGSYTLPMMIYPTSRPSMAQTFHFRKRIELLREYNDEYEKLIQYIYHATLEEKFLINLAKHVHNDFGHYTEAGVRELTGMRKFLEKLIDDLELTEDVRVEEAIKRWVKLHSNARFRPHGMRMRRSRRRSLRAWKVNVDQLKRTHEQRVEISKFMRHWENRFGKKTNVVEYRHSRQRKLKQAAKRLRKKRMQKVLSVPYM
jgi:hypothetical protein